VVKLSNIMSSPQSAVEYSKENIPFENIPFEKVKALLNKCNNFTSLRDVITQECVNEIVNVNVYVQLENSEIVDVTTKYCVKKKRDVSIYDESFNGVVKLTSWNAKQIDLIKHSVTYKISELRVHYFDGK